MGIQIVRNPNTRDPIQAGEQYVLDCFSRSDQFDGWRLYEHPHLNGQRPDFLLVHPECGMVIIEVKDHDLQNSCYMNGKLLLDSGKEIDIDSKFVSQIKSYKKNLQEMILRKFADLYESEKSNAFASIETILYFHNSSIEEAANFIRKAGSFGARHITILDRQSLEQIALNQANAPKRSALRGIKSRFAKNGLLQEMAAELHQFLEPSNYQKERSNPIELQTEQRKYLSIKPGTYRRLSGVAGSGKSLLLATKTANLLKEGHRVLIATYNITMCHYLRDLVSLQFGEGDRGVINQQLVIVHFHRLLSTMAVEHDAKYKGEGEFDRWEEEQIKHLNQHLREDGIKHDWRFDDIFIDEGQDYKREWYKFLIQLFTKRGEVCIYYDLNQDLYDRKAGVWIEDSSQIRGEGLGFRGRPGHLKYNFRNPETTSLLLAELRKHFGDPHVEEVLTKEDQLGAFDTRIEWHNLRKQKHPLDGVKWKVKELRENGASLDDIAILVISEQTALSLLDPLKQEYGRITHVFDESGQADLSKRRNEKWKFQPGNGSLKCSTVKSFKGWESSHIILVLDGNNDGVGGSISNMYKQRIQLYNAISRVRWSRHALYSSFTCFNYLTAFNQSKEVVKKFELVT